MDPSGGTDKQFDRPVSIRDGYAAGAVAGATYEPHSQAARGGEHLHEAILTVNPRRDVRSDCLSLDTVDEAFRYHPWNHDQADRGAQVREALVAAAKAILRVVPPSPARTRALNHLQDARMLANHAITHGGRF